MDWSEQLGNINWWAVIAATASSFVVGFIWYAWGTFGKRWAGHVGLSKKEIESSDGMNSTYLMTGVASFVSAVVLAMLMIATGTNGVWNGLVFGAVLGFAFRMGTHAIHNGFERKNPELVWINGGHDVVALALAGAIIGGIS